MKINLISAYEELMKIDPEQRVTERDSDYRTYKQSATNEQIESVYEKALSAIGMTEEEMIANATQFPYWQDIFNRMSSHLSNVPDPTIGVEEMNRYGYTWDGMLPINQTVAEEFFGNGSIFRLYPNNTESEVESLAELREHAKNGGIFGIDKESWEICCEYRSLQKQIAESQSPEEKQQLSFKALLKEQEMLEPAKARELFCASYDTYGIYQIIPDTDERANLMYRSYNYMQKDEILVDRANYRLVYTAPLDIETTLEDIFTKFNIDIPSDYTGRSLSVSDVVVLKQGGEISAHFVDSIGFREVPSFLSLEQNVRLSDDVDYAKLPDQPKKTAKDKLEEITAKLEQGIADVCTSENYQAYLKTMAKFHKYSYNNSLLIWMQKPEATMVAGYNAWKSKFERQVMKGEHGITIIAPCPSQKTEEILKLDPKTLQPILDSNGVPVKEKTTISSMRFKATTVFDVSQTEGKPLPAPPIKDLSGNVENYATMLQALIQAAPCPVSFGDPGSGAKGSFDRGTQSITIKEGMSQQETLATLVHEIGHSHLHADPEEAKKLERGTREVQAESVAYTVCSHYGIDTSEWTFGYVATWSKGKEIKTLQSVLDTIRSTSAKIIDQTDEQLDLIQSQRLQPQQQQNDLSLTMNMS